MLNWSLLSVFVPTFFLVSLTPGMCMTLAMVLGYAAFFSIGLLVPLWLQRNLGYTALWAGLASAPLGVLPVLGHALRNAAIPIATTVGVGIALLIGGVEVTETVFAIPGVGRLVIDSVQRHDYPVIQSVLLLSAGVYVLINLLIDLSYRFFDPRIQY